MGISYNVFLLLNVPGKTSFKRYPIITQVSGKVFLGMTSHGHQDVDVHVRLFPAQSHIVLLNNTITTSNLSLLKMYILLHIKINQRRIYEVYLSLFIYRTFS